ncbi:MAG: hypothetical protein JWP25_2148 [Bradyrhizobium sp.]|nr:hypothetical protein [Bradyrhizobium sp.]
MGRALEGQQSRSVQEVHRARTNILQKFGGKVLARGGKFKILEGAEKFHRFIVIEFPNFEKAAACYESPEYLEAAAHRKKDGASELEIVIVESI